MEPVKKPEWKAKNFGLGKLFESFLEMVTKSKKQIQKNSEQTEVNDYENHWILSLATKKSWLRKKWKKKCGHFAEKKSVPKKEKKSTKGAELSVNIREPKTKMLASKICEFFCERQLPTSVNMQRIVSKYMKQEHFSQHSKMCGCFSAPNHQQWLIGFSSTNTH